MKPVQIIIVSAALLILIVGFFTWFNSPLNQLRREAWINEKKWEWNQAYEETRQQQQALKEKQEQAALKQASLSEIARQLDALHQNQTAEQKEKAAKIEKEQQQKDHELYLQLFGTK